MKKPPASTNLLVPGSFTLGCNYWASHAGTGMWRDWQPGTVRADLKRLAGMQLQVLRVFPLWPDFQPLTALVSSHNRLVEYRFGEEPLPDHRAGRAGLSPTMLQRFAEFADLAEEQGLKLVVALLTGWMSGRLFMPPAFQGLNPMTNPAVLRWEVRFVTEFVRAFRQHPAIVAWEFGNECNCMDRATRDEAYLWSATIANAVRAADPQRPFFSGMHGIGMARDSAWHIRDQAELTDLLTTHPYPIFTPHCELDPLNTMRACLHATAESRFYGDIGEKPCFAEELGTLGPIIASDRLAADYIRTALFSLWAHDCRGLFWWCSFDQKQLTHAPYDWCALERELGLFRNDGSAKPVAAEFKQFRKTLDSLPFRALPPRLVEGCCILSQDQDHWGVAFGTFLLAKQAGLDLTFHDDERPFPDAPLYLLPSVRGGHVIPRRRWQQLLKKVEQGATLYVSLDDAFISDFEGITGLEVQTRQRRAAASSLILNEIETALPMPCAGGIRQRFKATRAAVLAREPDGNPAFTVSAYGKGKVFVLAFPLEQLLVRTPGVFADPEAPPYWTLYRMLGTDNPAGRVLQKDLPQVGVTEHVLETGAHLAVLINYAPDAATVTLSLTPGWHPAAVLLGNKPRHADEAQDWTLALAANSAAVLRLEQAAR